MNRRLAIAFSVAGVVHVYGNALTVTAAPPSSVNSTFEMPWLSLTVVWTWNFGITEAFSAGDVIEIVGGTVSGADEPKSIGKRPAACQ